MNRLFAEIEKQKNVWVAFDDVTHHESIPTDRCVSNFADRPDKTGVTVLDLSIPLQTLLNDLQDAEPFDLSAFKASTNKPENV